MAPPKRAAGKANAAKSESTEGRPRACLLSQLRKTKFCAYHLKGTCQYGDSCAFAHSYDELQGTPDLRNTRLCPDFQEHGTCERPGCNFAHGEDELRSTAMFFRKTLCIWNEKGKCRNGDQCRFAHGKEQLKADKVPPMTAANATAIQETGRRQRGAAKAARNNDSSSGSTCIGSGASSCSDEPMKISVGAMGAGRVFPPGLENDHSGEALQELDHRHNLSMALQYGDQKGAVVNPYFDPMMMMGMGGYEFAMMHGFARGGFGEASADGTPILDDSSMYARDVCFDGGLGMDLPIGSWGYGGSHLFLGS
mmetsp:Transcript_63881/g.181354  ORF Transcript_63881/g.181354 Transcript_63881/m.181354 type:complete len:309 (-) Transcript_63881:156-1082(-)